MKFIQLAQVWDKWRSLVKSRISPVMLVEHILEFALLQFRFQSSIPKIKQTIIGTFVSMWLIPKIQMHVVISQHSI